MTVHKEISLKISDNILDAIKEEHRQAALNFFGFLKPNKLSIRGNKITYKGKRMGSFGIFDNKVFQLSIQMQFDEHFSELVAKESEHIQKFVKERIDYTGCGRCITGKCSATHLDMRNPDESFYDFAQKLLLLRIEAIKKEQVPKCNYIKIADRGTQKKCVKCNVCNPACRKLKNF